MRILTLAACIVAVGILAALPFRHNEAALDTNAPVGIATGPLARQMNATALDTAAPWPTRPDFDPSLAWQPQPMTMDITPPSFELPSMPDTYPADTIEVPIPAAVGDRFDAVLKRRQTAAADGLLAPIGAQLEDRFVYTPLLEPAQSSRPAPIQSASMISSEPSREPSSAPRQYIREPQ